MAGERPISAREEEKGEHISPLRYFAVLVALCLLAALSFGLSRLPTGAWSLPAAVIIAVVKALLVILFFMHLWEHQGANRLVLGVAFFFVVLLMSLAVADVATRFPVADPPTSGPAREFYGPMPLPPPDKEHVLQPQQQPHAGE